MIHDITIPTDNGVRCHFTHLSERHTYDFRRTVIGLVFPESSEQRIGTGYGFAVVVGERCYFADDPRRLPERVYIVLEDVDDTQSAPLFDKLIDLKDRYLCSVVYCPPSPGSLYESLRRHEGIAFYGSTDPLLLSRRYTHFVSRSCVAGIRTITEDDGTMQRDLDFLLNATAMDPNTKEPIRYQDGSHAALPRLIIPENLKTQETQKGISIGTPEIQKALWLAIKGMEISPRWMPRRQGTAWEEVQDRGITGYS